MTPYSNSGPEALNDEGPGRASCSGLRSMNSSYPIYLLQLGKKWKIVFPDGKVDIGHCDFWEQTVSFMVAEFFKVPQRKLLNLPYSQRRARICGNTVYYGEVFRLVLLAKIKKAVKNKELVFAHDEHEQRLAAEIRQFKRLVDTYAPKSP